MVLLIFLIYFYLFKIKEIGEKLVSRIEYSKLTLDNENVVTNIRHKQLIDCAKQNAKEGIESINPKVNINVSFLFINTSPLIFTLYL